MEECRELLGRIVGDRGIARMVFGTGCHSMRVKTVALSTQVDVVSDDAIPNIHLALRENELEPRPYVTGGGAPSDAAKSHKGPFTDDIRREGSNRGPNI